MLQTADDPLGVVQQIRDEHHHASLRQRIGQLVERFRHVGVAPELHPVEHQQQRPQVPRPRAGGQHVHDPLVEGRQADRVPLAVHQIRQRRRQARRVLELGDAARAVRHRPADVDHQVAGEVGLLLEFLDVVPIASRVHLPVDGGEIVAGDVLPVFGKLDAEALERTAVEARQEPFDDRAGLELERAQARDDGRVEELPLAHPGLHRYIPLLGTGTVSRRRSMIASELMRSDSA